MIRAMYRLNIAMDDDLYARLKKAVRITLGLWL